MQLQEEDQARDDLAQQMTKMEVQSGGSGGFHSVLIPLSAGAKAALDRLQSGEVNFVVLVGLF